MKKKSKKIVVTGAAGFIGLHLSQALLERGWRVIGIDSMNDYYDPRIKRKRLALLKKNAAFRFYKVNIARYAAVEKILKTEKPDEIVHLAAQAGVRHSLSDPWSYLESNELGTLNIFEAAKRLAFSRVLFASSSSVYGTNTKSPMSEDDRTDSPMSIYAATKKANEALAHSYHHLYGIECIGLRFFTVYGTWGRPDMALFKFAKNILIGAPIDVYNRGRMLRSFTHVSDIVAGILGILAKPSRGRYKLYNLGGAETIPLLEFIGQIERATGKKAVRRLLPMQSGDVRESVADWSKARADFGFTPAIGIEAGISEFVDWFRENERFLLSLREPRQ
ncbi:NAD-dependent epimerase/dehydratase family protein [Patescibacteria group bacterium]|nr:NAD-dependent epimerase/dehydratase family protein [Patescibacteria group bacterium]